jgi:hypothetical protein
MCPASAVPWRSTPRAQLCQRPIGEESTRGLPTPATNCACLRAYRCIINHDVINLDRFKHRLNTRQLPAHHMGSWGVLLRFPLWLSTRGHPRHLAWLQDGPSTRGVRSRRRGSSFFLYPRKHHPIFFWNPSRGCGIRSAVLVGRGSRKISSAHAPHTLALFRAGLPYRAFCFLHFCLG